MSAAHQSKCNLIGYDTTKSLAAKTGAAGLLCEEVEGKILRVLLTARVCKKGEDERIYEKDTEEDLNKFIVKELILEYIFKNTA